MQNTKTKGVIWLEKDVNCRLNFTLFFSKKGFTEKKSPNNNKDLIKKKKKKIVKKIGKLQNSKLIKEKLHIEYLATSYKFKLII
jgi:hypothetical protein